TAAESPEDPILRDFSAKCLDEYLSWSVRQNRSENVDKFFLRLIDICRHNNCRKRLAACQIFNGIYRTFREYDDLIDKYLLELFVDYMLCLQKCQYEDSDGIVCTIASERTIAHLERILIKKRILLSKKEHFRITPRVLKDATVPSFVDWLFHNIGKTDVKFRRKCLELMLNLESKVSLRDRCQKESLHSLIER
uniref:DNA-dependent protein kinase catalytic subunit CC1/2 domain-containing protein n=1 Tax=Romanomermis culicivorax TaxID=13658 RepID=A0A915IWA3_ROMCU